MFNQIQKMLVTFSQWDKRTDFCKLETAVIKENKCTLTGSLLDENTLTKVNKKLQLAFPTITFDFRNVNILSQPVPLMLSVGTNATSVMSNTSWGSELMSEVLNGWTVEVLMEQERWAFTRQSDGYLGWVYRPYLTETAVLPTTHMLYTPITLLRTQPTANSELVGRAFGGTAVSATDQTGQWLQLQLAGGLSGWILQDDARPLHMQPSGTDERRETIITNAHNLIGIPYLWGGGTAHGLDCSGFSQLLYRLAGVTIPRDADMQFAAGTPIEPPFDAGNLLYFGGEKNGHRIVSHVGISIDGWQMVHASRSRNGVYIDNVHKTPSLMDMYLGARSFL